MNLPSQDKSKLEALTKKKWIIAIFCNKHDRLEPLLKGKCCDWN